MPRELVLRISSLKPRCRSSPTMLTLIADRRRLRVQEISHKSAIVNDDCRSVSYFAADDTRNLNFPDKEKTPPRSIYC